MGYPRDAAMSVELTGELHNAVIGFLASATSRLFVLNQEDLTKETEQQNLPGSTWEYPDWRRKMRYSIEELEGELRGSLTLRICCGVGWNGRAGWVSRFPMFKFLHAADIHLDSPLLGAGAVRGRAGGGDSRGDAAGVGESGAAGDRGSGRVRRDRGRSVRRGLAGRTGRGSTFVKQMARLREAKIPVFVIAGNHDAENKMTRELRFPENVKMFSSRRAGDGEAWPTLAVAIHGQSYVTADVRENLAEEGIRSRSADAFNIGLLHTCVAGAAGHAPYAPCSVGHLTGKGYQYWALGHVHTAQALQRGPADCLSRQRAGPAYRRDGRAGVPAGAGG